MSQNYPQQPYNPNQQPQWQQPQPQQQPPAKKNNIGRNIIIGIAAGFALIGGCSALSGGGTPNATPTPLPNVVTTGQATPVKPTPAKPAVKPAPKHWVKLVTLTGSAGKSTDTINIRGGKVRVTYTFALDNKYTDTLVGAVYILKEGVDPMVDGAIPDVMVSKPGKDTTTIRRDGGAYYLRVVAASTKYTVTVEEER